MTGDEDEGAHWEDDTHTHERLDEDGVFRHSRHYCAAGDRSPSSSSGAEALEQGGCLGGPTHQHARESGRWKVEATRGEGPTEYGGWLRAGFIAGLACAVVAFGGQPDAASGVGPVKVTFSDVIIERTPCKDGQTSAGRQVGGLPGPGNGREMSERPDFTNGCFTVSALANNPGKKELRNADVFGRVYDKYGNTTRDDTENSKNESAPQATPSRF